MFMIKRIGVEIPESKTRYGLTIDSYTRLRTGFVVDLPRNYEKRLNKYIQLADNEQTRNR